MGAITVRDLRRWRGTLATQKERWANHPTKPTAKGGLSPWTLHGYMRAARYFFRWLVKEGMLANSPAERLELPPLPQDEPPKAISANDMRKLIAVAHSSSVRDYAIVLVLADTGCRVGGLVSLTPADLELERQPPRATVREKGQKARPVFFRPITAEALHAWLLIRPENKGDRLFIGRRGSLTTSGVYSLLRRLANKAGVTDHYNPHAFRHGFARGALLKGADLGTISDLLGHSNIDVTKRFYARWEEDELGHLHQRFSWVDDDENTHDI